MPFHPILLKGHRGPISQIRYNREGDLIFSTATKDKTPVVWYAHNGERLGTYNGHEGAVWDAAVNFSSTRLLTASADRTAKLWDVESGKELFSFDHKASVRTVGFAAGDRMFLTAQENNFNQRGCIYIFNAADDPAEQTAEPVRSMFCDTRIYKVLWGSLNQTLISCGEDGYIRKWDVETGKELDTVLAHKKAIKDMRFSKDGTMFITASSDMTAKLYDTKTLKCLKTYQSDRPLNSAALSPTMNHVIVGGGQDAMNVTQTSAKVGHFEVDFHHLIYEYYMGSVKGHFGPVNSVEFCPDGKSYASGSEDGYVRLHHFERSYFNPRKGAN